MRYNDDDPLCLDGPIIIGRRSGLGTGRGDFEQNHVRITNGEIVEDRGRELDVLRHQQQHSRRRRMDGDDVSDGLSSIPSYDMGQDGPSRLAALREDAENLGNLDTEEEELMIFGNADDSDRDRRDPGVAAEEKLEGASQSYFSSQQSETIDSDMMMALQRAISENGGRPEGLDPFGASMSGAEGQEAGMLMF